MSDSNPQAEPGWYPANDGTLRLRWWDGARWTDHLHDPGVSYAANVQLSAPAGTNPYTAWIWILAILPLLGMVSSISYDPTAALRNSLAHPDDPFAAYSDPSYLVALLIGFVLYGLNVLISLLDYRSLRAEGVPRPFHWAWSFLHAGVYVIGRAIISKRRIGRGLAPLWVWVALTVATTIAATIIVVLKVAALAPILSHYSTYGPGY